MTPQEALAKVGLENALNALLEYEKFAEYSNKEDELKTIREAIDAYKTILNSVEKQIPKKPSYEGDGYDDKGNLIYDTAYCPNCDKEFEVDYYSGKCCDDCGQALDWSD